MKRTRICSGALLCGLSLLAARPAFAIIALGTESPETIAPLGVESELTYESSHIGGISPVTEGEFDVWIATGLTKSLDIAATVPYLAVNPDVGKTQSGLGDLKLDLKWHFLSENADRPSLALKLGYLFTTGNDAKGLGEGVPEATLSVLAAKHFGPVGIFLNAGYTRVISTESAETSDVPGAEAAVAPAELTDIFSASLAGEWKLIKQLSVVGEVAMETTEVKGESASATGTIGAVYQMTKNFAVDAGIRAGLTSAAPDWAVLAGVKLSF
ncbi:MAG: transporter [Candidatus Methylomirabilia bacterium]